MYKRALANTKVNTEFKELAVDIQTNKKNYLPWDSVTGKIIVKNVSWKPVKNANVYIALLDESILALKWNPKKNPYGYFYGKTRYLGVSTVASLKNIIDKLEIRNYEDGEKWWGWGEALADMAMSKSAESEKNAVKKRWDFRDTAFLRANLTTDENGIAELNINKLPDNLTTWLIEVLVNTKDTELGINYETITTSKPLQVRDNLPSFLGSEDTITLSPVVFNRTGKDQKLTVTLDATNIEVSKNKTEIFVLDWEQKTVSFEIKVGNIAISWDKLSFVSKMN